MTENEKNREENKQAYAQLIEDITPKACLWKRCLRAFWVGGIICVIGQTILYVGEYFFDLSSDDASGWCTLLLILISVILTNFGLYRNIVSYGGAGALVPITGFANSVASAATEFKAEGWVFGVGCKIFTIAGPVILYGVVTSFIFGFIYWIMKITGMA